MASDALDNTSFSEVVSTKERKKKKKPSGAGSREKRGRESGDGAWVQLSREFVWKEEQRNKEEMESNGGFLFKCG